MRDEAWLNPFSEVAPRLKIEEPAPSPPATHVPEPTAEERAIYRARVHARVWEVIRRMKRFDASPDPEAPLMALFAAHETAVVEAAAAARQKLASRQAAWRQARALDGQPVA